MKLIKSGTISRSEILHNDLYKSITPRPTQKDFNKMYDDMESKGQLKPVCADEDWNLVDGYTRDEILGKQRIDDIKYEQWEFDSEVEKIDYINSMNLKRRHLSKYQKFEASLITYEKEVVQAESRQKSGTLASKEAKGKATAKAAKEADMSTTTFERALHIHSNATLEQKKKLYTGETKITTLHTQLTRKDRNLPKVPLPKTISDVFLADVPYGYEDKGGRGAAETHYPTMTIDELIQDFSKLAAADNAIMFFWMSPSIQYSEVEIKIDNLLVGDKSIDVKYPIPFYKAVLDAAGFKVKQEFVWNKKKIGVGSWNRNQHENLLMAIKGEMPVPAKLFSSIIEELRSEHSKKPDLWHMIKKMYPKRNYAELYARVKTPGVLCHGNQIVRKGQ
ncbi:MAG: hypothetical protein JKY15_01870 [Deltaproteobacteria bacterium]|nr:hypothetical protein [Deltaproteobacteria bacterium]